MPEDAQIKQEQPPTDAHPGDDGQSGLLGGFPPTGLLLLAIVSIQLGAALATNLFPILGAEGTVAIRIIISALLLGERLGVQGMVAITCVVVAAIGITVTDGREKKQ